MDINHAIDALGALAQESRLQAFRLLARAGDGGLPAGDIAASLGVPHNTLSTHLGILTRAGLLASERSGRQITYRVDFDGTRAVLEYLLEDCCQGSPDLCARALDAVLPACCARESGDST